MKMGFIRICKHEPDKTYIMASVRVPLNFLDVIPLFQLDAWEEIPLSEAKELLEKYQPKTLLRIKAAKDMKLKYLYYKILYLVYKFPEDFTIEHDEH